MAYGAGDVLVRAEMQCVTGLAADTVVNDFAFRNEVPPDDDAWEQYFTWVNDFYREPVTIGPETETVSGFIGDYVNRAATHRLVGYRISAGPLGAPDAESEWLGPVAARNGDNVPAEVAAVLSFRGSYAGAPAEVVGATRPRARRRGRIYIGPLCTDALKDTGTIPRLGDLPRQTFQAAAVRLMDDSFRLWSVWSRADATLYEVVGGWTDDALDSQRRRGPAASSRSTYGDI